MNNRSMKAQLLQSLANKATLCTCAHTNGAHALGGVHPCRAYVRPGVRCTCPGFQAEKASEAAAESQP